MNEKAIDDTINYLQIYHKKGMCLGIYFCNSDVYNYLIKRFSEFKHEFDSIEINNIIIYKSEFLIHKNELIGALRFEVFTRDEPINPIEILTDEERIIKDIIE